MPKFTTPWFHHRSMNDYQKANPKPGNQNPKTMKTKARRLPWRQTQPICFSGQAAPF